MLAEGRPLRRGSALGSASRAAAEALRGVGEAAEAPCAPPRSEGPR